VRECLKARQSKKAACSFDGVNESENVAENLAVIGLSLKAHQLCVDAIEAFGRLVKNSRNNSSMNASCRRIRGGLAASKSLASTNGPQRTRESVAKAFNFGCGIGESDLEKVPFFVNRRLR